VHYGKDCNKICGGQWDKVRIANRDLATLTQNSMV